ncbi:MAG: penicillin-binding protein 2 [Alphaproteobacteria bacterium]|nr:penicillin-binding protein 2 [Alphaproteobacteria bacterium]
MLPLGLSKKTNTFYDIKPSRSNGFETALFEESTNLEAVQTCRNRMSFAVILFFLAYIVLSVRVFMVCLPHGIKISLPDEEYAVRDISVKLPISRADIVDRNGLMIATSLPTVNLYANPKKIQDAKDAAEKLSLIFPDLSYDDIYAKLTKKRSSFAMIKHDLSPAQQANVNDLGIPALEFQTSEKRVYLHSNLFAHVLGYTNVDNVGQAGLEKFMHKRLTESSKPLKLTLDIGVQDTIREELLHAVEKYKAIGAAAILMDVNTGEVLSLVSLPDYNPNIKIPVGEKSLFNFITQAAYEPGSVFKTFNTALGLESGKVKVTDKFDATKPIVIQKRKIHDDHAKNRWLTVDEILTYSSNIGSVRIAEKVGKEGQISFLKNLGFFNKIEDFEISEKARPLYQSEKNWAPITIATVSYGHGISVSPLHIITAFSALVNGGIYHTPTLIKSDTQKVSRRVLSEHTSKQMRPLLRNVVLYGSGKQAEVAGYEVGGKTGTANKADKGSYATTRVTNSFISTFPSSDPKYALLVIIDEPQGVPETHNLRASGWNAAPTSGKIIASIAPQLGLKANFDINAQKAYIKAIQ